MLYLLEVTDNKYKIYDSESKDIFIKDVEFLERNVVLGVVNQHFYRPFLKREIKLANLLELISVGDCEDWSRSLMFWSLDTITWICYYSVEDKDCYKNLIALIWDIFVNYPRSYEVKDNILKIYLFEQTIKFRIKDIKEFELMKTKIVCLTKKENK